MAFSIPTWTTKWLDPSGLISKPWYQYLTNLQNAIGSGLTPVTNGGTGLTGGTSGGVLAFTSATALTSSPALGINRLVLGGGAGGTPMALGTLGSTTQVLHGNAAGAPTFGPVALATDVSGLLPGANIAANAVTNALLAQMGARTIKGNNTGATANAADLSAGQFPATQTNDNANAGNIAEYSTATLAAASSISLATATAANLVSVNLTAGDWDISGSVGFTPGGATTIQYVLGAINSVSATVPSVDLAQNFQFAESLTGGADTVGVTPVVRISITSTTPVYLIARSAFGVSTMNSYGTIRARRMR